MICRALVSHGNFEKMIWGLNRLNKVLRIAKYLDVPKFWPRGRAKGPKIGNDKSENFRVVFVLDCNLSNFGGPSSRKECHWTQVSTADLKHFLNMLSDPVIKAFHAHDTCCLTSDRYLLAMVFVYFKKAKLEHEEYNRLNFFKALYLGTSLSHVLTNSVTTNIRFFYFSKRYNFWIEIKLWKKMLI